MPAVTREQAALMREHGITIRPSDGKYGFNLRCGRPGCPNEVDGYCFASADLDVAIRAKKKGKRCNITCSMDCWWQWNRAWDDEADEIREMVEDDPALRERVEAIVLRRRLWLGWQLEALAVRYRTRALSVLDVFYANGQRGTPEHKTARKKAHRSLNYRFSKLLNRLAGRIGYRRLTHNDWLRYKRIRDGEETDSNGWVDNIEWGGHRVWTAVLRERDPALYRLVQDKWQNQRDFDSHDSGDDDIEAVSCEVY